MSDTVLLDVADGVATLTLNRPEAGNAMNMELVTALRTQIQVLGGRPDVRVVVLRGGGKMFCVGGDLGWMASREDRDVAIRELADELHAGLLALRALDAPVVAVVQATAAGAGFSLVAGADIVLAGQSASFVMAYTKVGLTPDGGSSWWLPRIVGVRRATELMLLNPQLTAADAKDAGLVSRVVADADLDAEADRVVAQLAAGPVGAHGAVKRLLDATWGATFAEQMDHESEAIAAQAGGPEGREGVAAFLARRRPDFGGPEKV